jgi:stringent starvation protein B
VPLTQRLKELGFGMEQLRVLAVRRGINQQVVVPMQDVLQVFTVGLVVSQMIMEVVKIAQ